MKDRVPLPTSTPADKPAETKPREGPTLNAPSFMDHMDYHRFSDLLGVSYEERKDSHLASKVSFLTDWATEQSKSKDYLEQYSAIKNLVRGLGWQEKGQALVEKLYRYTRLDRDRKRIEKEMNIIL